MTKPEVIFFGNGPLADYALNILKDSTNIIFHAKTKENLETVKSLKKSHPSAHGVLASFGVMIKSDLLNLFEPEGILNIHPSLLPKYRGASPIESAILNGDQTFSVSIMKLVKAMDAGPIYYQTTLKDLPLKKSEIYCALATTGAKWLSDNLAHLPEPTPQDNSKATFTQKFNKADGIIDFKSANCDEILHKIIAFEGFPKVKSEIYGVNCTILEAHKYTEGEKAKLVVPCSDGKIAIDKIQPDGRKIMDAAAFLNGYHK